MKTIILLFLLAASAFAQELPALPQAVVSSTIPTTGQVRKVGADLQAAIDAAQSGDRLVLPDGGKWTGNFTLRGKSNLVFIRSGALPVGKATVANSAGAPRIETPNNGPALNILPGVNTIYFVGLEFGPSASVTSNGGLVTIGATDATQAVASAQPYLIVFSQCVIRGNATGAVRRGITANGKSIGVFDSSIIDIRYKGADAQAVCAWNGEGPFTFINSDFEATGENVMFGGADPKIPNLVPSDITVLRCNFVKPLIWRTQNWTEANLFELKNARRVLVKGCNFFNSWTDQQVGYGIVFTVRNQEGTAPWSTIEDVTFESNIIAHVGTGFQILAADYNFPSQRMKRVRIANNLLYDVNGQTYGGYGAFMVAFSGAQHVTVEHNTSIQTSRVMIMEPSAAYKHDSWKIINNIWSKAEYGVLASNRSEGNEVFANGTTNLTFIKNVLTGRPASFYTTTPGNFFPAQDTDVGYTDWAANSYALASGPYKLAGTDGKDLGVDYPALLAAFAGAPVVAAPAFKIELVIRDANGNAVQVIKLNQ